MRVPQASPWPRHEIALVDYGAGNLTSVKKAFDASRRDIFVPGAPRDLDDAAAVVVPGVGHFQATRLR